MANAYSLCMIPKKISDVVSIYEPLLSLEMLAISEYNFAIQALGCEINQQFIFEFEE